MIPRCFGLLFFRDRPTGLNNFLQLVCVLVTEIWPFISQTVWNRAVLTLPVFTKSLISDQNHSSLLWLLFDFFLSSSLPGCTDAKNRGCPVIACYFKFLYWEFKPLSSKILGRRWIAKCLFTAHTICRLSVCTKQGKLCVLQYCNRHRLLFLGHLSLYSD